MGLLIALAIIAVLWFAITDTLAESLRREAAPPPADRWANPSALKH